VDGDGRVLLVVVDGRRRASVGMDLVGLAKLMRRLGAVSALNLDGGGSSTMVVRGKVKNRPSDGWERPRSSAVLVLDGDDPGERIRVQAMTGATGAEPVEVSLGDGTAGREGFVGRRGEAFRGRGASALYDPGSTGGLLDAVDRGLFGGRGAWLTPQERGLLFRFRSAVASGGP
jgi:hypothetical protein